MILSPNMSTLVFPTTSPSLSMHTLLGMESRVASASANIKEGREEWGPGVERRKEVQSLSLSFHELTPLALWFG